MRIVKSASCLVSLALVAAPPSAQLVEQRLCPRQVCFVTDKGKVVPLEGPLEKYSDKQWRQIRYERPERPKLTIAASVQNVRDVSTTTTTYDGEEETETAVQEPILPIGGLEDLMVDALLRTKLFDVVERVALDEIYQEREDFLQETLSSLTAGQYLAIASFGEVADTQSGSARGIKTALGRLGLGRAKSKVVVTMRVVDVGTGKVVFTALETGSLGSWRGSVQDEDSDRDEDDPEEEQSAEVQASGLLSQAAVVALNKAAFKVARWAMGTPWWSTIIKVQQDDPHTFLYIAGGRQQGLTKGTKLAVWSQGEELVHPITGEVLGSDRVRMGTATVRDVREQFSIAKVEEGNPDVDVGDQVELLPVVQSNPAVKMRIDPQ